MKNNTVIICASGNSISDGVDYELFDVLKEHTTIGLNHWYKHAFEPTFNSFVDWNFYRDSIDNLSKLQLIIGKYDSHLNDLKMDNSILLPKHSTYFGKDSWKIWERTCLNCRYKYTDDYRIPRPDKCPNCKTSQVQKFGFYSGHLSGLFSLTLAIALGFKNIYLLGYDCCEYKDKTHFYQDEVDLKKRNVDNIEIYSGIGMLQHQNGVKAYKTSTYNSVSELNNNWYKPYLQELHDVNIVNVSMPSKLTVFPKMDYIKFLSTIGKGNVDQMEVREEIKDFIQKKIKT